MLSERRAKLLACLLGLAAFLTQGCGSVSARHSRTARSGDTRELLATARSLLGTPYHFEGDSPQTGFDCSGFTSWVYSRHGVSLPRKTRDQFHAGRSVGRAALEPGDLLFFSIQGGGPSHVALYEGDGIFIHAPSTGGSVKEAELSQKYWKARFVGARRILH